MCGIAGLVHSDSGKPVDFEVVRGMCQTIVHRGPDDEGIYLKDNVGLGMRRLSIIDLASGHQPIHNEDKTVWVVFNGEIYNFPQLRKELEHAGHRFYTNADTEVIVHLYEDLGAACVQKLRGMFTFAIYDQGRQKLFLARDRVGKKPLYYAFHHGCLLFGSEIKAILAAAPELAEVNRQSMLQFFSLGYIPDPDTAFTPIQQLPPAHWLEFHHGKTKVEQYWDLPPYGTSQPLSEEECLRELEQHLDEAVRIRMISDVPLGALLSGGADSSVVVALMARASSRPVKTFSIGFRNQDFDETPHARLVAQKFKTDHHELIVDPDISGTLDRLTRIMEEPFADSSILPTYFVSCLARKHVTVALSGDGGDELFAGYDRYLVNLRRRYFDFLPHWAGEQYRNHVYPRLPGSLRGRKLSYNLSLPSRERYLDGISFQNPSIHGRNVFSPDFANWARRQPSPLDRYRRYLDSAPASDPLSRLLYLDTKTYLPADILAKVDRMSMATSLEVRAPILDHIFLEFVTRLPARWKLRGGVRKYIFRKLAERLGVPNQVLARPKQGFSLPLVHWMRKDLKKDLALLLLEPRTMQRGYFDSRSVERLLDEHHRGSFDHSALIWQLLVFELWHRNFLESQQGVGLFPAVASFGRERSPLPAKSQTAAPVLQ